MTRETKIKMMEDGRGGGVGEAITLFSVDFLFLVQLFPKGQAGDRSAAGEGGALRARAGRKRGKGKGASNESNGKSPECGMTRARTNSWKRVTADVLLAGERAWSAPPRQVWGVDVWMGVYMLNSAQSEAGCAAPAAGNCCRL